MTTSAWQRSPEVELLLCCTRPSLTDKVSERIRSIVQDGLNWEDVILRSLDQRLLPSLVSGLKATCPELVPPAVMGQLEKELRENLRRTLFLTAELTLLLTAFGRDGIPVISYKGPLLALSLYGHLARRQFKDLDLLVPKEDIGRAQETLRSLGYVRVWPRLSLTEAQERAHLRAKYNYQFVRHDSGVAVELHWSVAPMYFRFPPDDRWLWQQLECATLAGLPVQTFGLEQYLLILCVHGGNHCWIRLSWISDIAALIEQHPTLDWGWALEQARSTGVERMLSIGLLLAQDLFETPLPEPVCQMANRDATAKSLACEVSRQFSSSRREMPAAFNVPLFHLRGRERLRDKLGYCMAMLAPSERDWSTWSLPQPLSPLYYLSRPIRLLCEYGFEPLRQQIRHWGGS